MAVQLLENTVCLFLVVPEFRVGGNFFEVLYLFLSVIDFKDTPVTGPGDGLSPAVVLSVVQTLRLLLFLLVGRKKFSTALEKNDFFVIKQMVFKFVFTLSIFLSVWSIRQASPECPPFFPGAPCRQ
ncbi:MAG: hypothetical protein HQ516_04290 [Chlorobium sp.]|nr:hypothetical protein [Chlorobium sp.]